MLGLWHFIRYTILGSSEYVKHAVNKELVAFLQRDNLKPF